MATTTSPDNIFVLETSDNDTPSSWQPAMATSVQNALLSRALKTFKWASATERGAQTGMSEGDLGYQEDTEVTYQYDGSAWGQVIPPIDRVQASLVVSGTSNFALTGTLSKITSWPTEVYRAGGATSLASGTYTVGEDGWYSINTYFMFSPASGAVNAGIQILKNSTVIAHESSVATNTSIGGVISTSAGAHFLVGDTIEVWGQRTSGDISSRRLSIRRVGA